MIVPLFPLPDASVTVVPDPSSNAYAATRPDEAAIDAGAHASSATPSATAIVTALQMRPIRPRRFRDSIDIACALVPC